MEIVVIITQRIDKEDIYNTTLNFLIYSNDNKQKKNFFWDNYYKRIMDHHVYF
jgi:hypothetical protein